MKNESLNRLMQEMSKKKTPKKNTKDIIIDSMGQWAHPGENTRIPSSQITMQGVPYPVRGIDNNGYEQMMYPNQEYTFPGADYVDEFPQLKNGGSSKSIVCPNCGWSWNVDKGDPDPFLCHKCGEIAKMQGGGQYGYPQYQYGGEIDKAQLGSLISPVNMVTGALRLADFIKGNGKNTSGKKEKITLNKIDDLETKNNFINILDPRKKLLTSGQPLRSNVDLLNGRYNTNLLGKALTYAKTKNMSKDDLMNLASMAFQETKWGRSDDNIGHVLHDWEGDNKLEQFVNAYDSKMKQADRLKYKDPALRLQVYNGLGKIFPETEKNYHGFRMKKIYGVPVPEEGIDMKKNPLYGKQILDVKNNVLAKSPEFMHYIDSTYNSHKEGGYIPKAQRGINVSDNTAVRYPQRDMRTVYEALDEKIRARQPWLQQASSPINDERRRQLNERYAQQSGKRYNPTTGNVEDRFNSQQDRMLNKAYENIVEPMIDAEMIASAAPLLRKGIKAAGKYLTEETALRNAYKYNPWAEKLINANKSYRVAGLDALEDFQNTGVLRSVQQGVPEGASLTERAMSRPTGFPSFQKGYADMRYAPKEGAVIFETDLPTFKRGEINPVTGFKIKGRHYAHRVIDPKTGATLAEIPAANVKAFGDKPDWLTGYKEVPTFKKSSLESVFSGDKLQEKFNKILNFQQLPELNNSNATEVLENFRKRIKTPEGKQRLKDLGITNKRVLDDLKIYADETGLAYYSPEFGKIGIHPQLPEFRNVTRHEIEHAVQDAVANSRIAKYNQDNGNFKYLFRPKAKKKALEYANKSTSDIDDLLSGLELRKTPEKVNWEETKATRGKQDPSELYDYMEDLQGATNYFDSGSVGAEKSAFLGEVQQHMMDKGIIPKDSYTKITPEMVKKTFIDAKFDENGGKYLRLFNIMKPNEKNYKLISDGLNKMLSTTPIVGGAALGAAALQQQKQGGLYYQQGGRTLPTIYTNNPNDPRLKAYQDSATLHNFYLQNLSKLKQFGQPIETDDVNFPDYLKYDRRINKELYNNSDIRKIAKQSNRLVEKNMYDQWFTQNYLTQGEDVYDKTVNKNLKTPIQKRFETYDASHANIKPVGSDKIYLSPVIREGYDGNIRKKREITTNNGKTVNDTGFQQDSKNINFKSETINNQPLFIKRYAQPVQPIEYRKQNPKFIKQLIKKQEIPFPEIGQKIIGRSPVIKNTPDLPYRVDYGEGEYKYFPSNVEGEQFMKQLNQDFLYNKISNPRDVTGYYDTKNNKTTLNKYQQGGAADNTNTGLQSKVLQQIKAKDFFNNKANEQIYLLQKAGYSEAHAKRAIKNKEKKAFDILEKINNDNYRIQMHPDYDPNKSVDEQSYLLNDNSLRARLLRGSNMMTNTGYPIQDFASSLITSPGRSFANMTTDANNKYFNSNNSGLENFANFAGDAVNVFPSLIPKAAGALGQVPNVMAKGAKNIKNATVAKALSTQLKYAKPKFNNELPKLGKRIDPINRSTVNMQNDFISQMTPEEYDDFMNYIYQNNKTKYDLPLIDFKGSRPNSFLKGIGSNEKEGLLFKEKFCLPGSECAKSANSVTNKMYTDVTGNPFDALGNAHNAWHMEDQMTRHGGVNINGTNLKVGDRILMGNGVDQSTYVPGYTADPRVRHAGVFAGLQQTENGPIPMIFESGKNNAMYLNPLNFTFTGENTALEAIRPEQFINDDFGKSLVNKNIRYAFRDKPSVATYNSNNKKIQSLLTEAEKYRETIKKTHDITNDEFDELLNNVVSVGAQETKLNGALPGSNLSKAKILLQNKLNDAGLLKPIKQTLNATKNILKNKPNSNLPSYPGSSKLEMEAVLYANENNIPFDEALNQVKSKYQEKPKFTVSTVEPSKGMFRQKYQTELDRLSNFGKDLKNKNDLENAIGQMSSNFNAIKKAYPNLSPRETIDLTTLMWNSPGKAMDKELVDFYLLGKNNPDINKYNFDYIRKVNDYKDKYINIKPRLTEPHYEFSRNGRYPEIQYQKGGEINYSDLQNINNNNMRKGGSTYNAGVWYQDGGTLQQDQQQEQMVQQIAEALQQGANPQKVVEALMQNGIDAEQAKGIVSAVMQQLQGQTPMAQDGEYVSEEMYAVDPSIDLYKSYLQNNNDKQISKKSDFSIVNYLNSIGQKSDFSTRKSLAKIYGIDNYTGTAKQNLMLAEKIKRDQVKSNKTVASKSAEPKRNKETITSNPVEKINNKAYPESSSFMRQGTLLDDFLYNRMMNEKMMPNQQSSRQVTSPKNKSVSNFAGYGGGSFGGGGAGGEFMQGGNIPNYMKEGNPMYNFGGYFPQGPRFDYGGQYLPYPYMNEFMPNLSEMKEGGIHIAPSKRGTFTAAATKHGKSVQGFASQVLANKENYSPAMVKKANFARNASKWKHESGGLVAGQVLDVTPDMLEQLKAGGYTFEIIND